MRRLIFILSLLALSGCATVYDDGYGYYRDDGYGDYYYGHAPATVSVGIGLGYGYGYGYSAYDSLFWGLQHSYFDPFWYPGFRYGVSYFPRYYGWSSWYGSDYWRWRSFHPYSPYYGSYWDHYYAWNPGYARGQALGRNGRGDPQRYGSARNAAERMARERGLEQRRMEQRSAWSSRSGVSGRQAVYGRSAEGVRGMPVGASRDRAWRGDGLPSRGYAPSVRGKRVEGGFSREPGRSDYRSIRGGVGDGRSMPSRPAGSARNELRSLPQRGMSSPRSLPGVRGASPAAPRSSAPGNFQRPAPAPRSMEARPSMRSERSMPSMRSSPGSSGGGRSMDRGGSSRGRSQR